MSIKLIKPHPGLNIPFHQRGKNSPVSIHTQVRAWRRPEASLLPVNTRWLWLIPVGLLISSLLMDEESTKILWSALVAAIACMTALAAVGYRLSSFVSIVAINHLVIFPLAAWANLLLPEPAVRSDLWAHTHLAMWGCAVGLPAMALGAWLGNYSAGPQKVYAYGRTFAAPTTVKLNVILFILIVPVVVLLVTMGMYYHRSIVMYTSSTQYGKLLNILAIVQAVAYSGIFLQVYRYTRTHYNNDAYWALGLCFINVMMYLPSGNRTGAFGFVPLLLLAFTAWESDARIKNNVFTGSIIVILALSHGMGTYRSVKGVESLGIEEKYETAIRSTIKPGKSQENFFSAIVGRMSDYVTAGRIIADTPRVIKYRGAELIEQWWQIYVPGFMNILPHRINMGDGAELSDRYGVTTNYKGGGSSPASIIGDLFSRWGWPGIFLGMMIIGFILRQFDLRIFYRWDAFTIIYFVLMGRFIFSISGGTVFSFFVTCFRESLAMALIAYLMAHMIETKKA